MSLPITILSAGAVQPGLTRVIAAFQRETGHEVMVRFATAPALLRAIQGGQAAEIVIAPSTVLDELLKSGISLLHERTNVGRIGVGVMVRDGSPLPKLATIEEFKTSLLGAGSIVYNQASTGVYLDKLLERLGIAAQLEGRKTCYPDFAGVLAHISQGKDDEIGFGATTVIIENASKGVKFAGPLPREIQNYTTYVAGLLGSTAEDGARALVYFFASSAAKTLFDATGIDCS